MPVAKPRYLTKSRYKLALECPTKLYYAGKPDKYIDSSVDDSFLRALARGGFQVGALARCLYSGGTEVTAMDHDTAVRETAALLEAENSIIYEAAFRHEQLFVRVDVLIKRGSQLRLLEVKAKSFDPDDEDPFTTKRDDKKLKSEYADYLYDVAFQAHVAAHATGLPVHPGLVLVNKKAAAKIEGLNQLFLIRRGLGGREQVNIKRIPDPREIGDLLIEIDCSRYVRLIHNGENSERSRLKGLTYSEEVAYLAARYSADERISPAPGRECKKCQFRAKPGEKRSGFRECWTQEGHIPIADVDRPYVFDVWRLHHAKSDALLARGTPLMRSIVREDLASKNRTKAPVAQPGLSSEERQWLQVESATNESSKAHIERKGIAAALSAWNYPLHFIDFETAAVAIPFTKGMRPYEAIAFQFSHHIVRENGQVEHAGQYLHSEAGKFPNFAFVRALKHELDRDNGSIFRYAAHENSILCRIHRQLADSQESDQSELMAWIETVTDSPKNSTQQWTGTRSMIDLLAIVRSYLFLPEMGGSLSIKKVLPAILNQGATCHQRYAQPIYGSQAGIRSMNFSDWTWLKYADGRVSDPYKMLEPVFRGIDTTALDLLTGEDDDLADGGAAMTAYAMMQFAEMPIEEHEALRQALFRYCELDTFAMVLLFEYLCEVAGLNTIPKVAA